MNCDMIYLVKDDNGTQVECLVTREDTGTAVDLTGATARLKFRKKRTTTVLFTLTNIFATSATLLQGKALFEFTGANLDQPAGLYEGELEVTFPNGNIETVFDVIDFQIRDDF